MQFEQLIRTIMKYRQANETRKEGEKDVVSRRYQMIVLTFS